MAGVLNKRSRAWTWTVAASDGVVEALNDQGIGHMQVEQFREISTTTCQTSYEVFVSGQEDLFSIVFNGFFRQIEGSWENQEVRGVFENRHVLELLGSQLNKDAHKMLCNFFNFFFISWNELMNHCRKIRNGRLIEKGHQSEKYSFKSRVTICMIKQLLICTSKKK